MVWDINALFQRHAREISRSLRKRGFDAETAADLTQDAFVRILRARPANLAPDYLMRAYLHRVARNLGINHAKRQGAIRTVSLDEPEALHVQAGASDAERIVASRQQLRLVQTVLASMPERQRRAFLLHRIGNLPVARIAEDIGLSTTRTWELIREAYRQIVLQTGGL